jgi:MYXO-CTERM domain-containing protein
VGHIEDLIGVFMRTSLLALLALAAPAAAFQPTDAGLAEQPDGRVHQATAAGQATARAEDSWQAFAQSEGSGWLARFDEVTLTPMRAWGPPIPTSPITNAQTAEAAARVFLSRHPGLAASNDKDLVLASANLNSVNGAWYVDLQQTAHGIPVEDALVTFRFVNDRLVMFGSTAVPVPDTAPVPAITPQAAVDTAITRGAAPGAAHEAAGVDLAYVSVLLNGGVQTRASWRVETETWAPRGQWVTWVDAETGGILRAIDNVKHISGTVSAEHDLRTVNGETTVSVLPYVRFLGSPATYADIDGSYDLGDATSVDGDLRGRYFRVRNEDGPEATFTVTGGELVLDDEDAHIAELDGYVFAHHVRDWGQRWAPEVDQGTMSVYVNVEGSCNAYYDGDINFLQADNQCNNTARVSDIVYHEWGHGFHGESLLAGTWDGSMGEAIGDTVAFLNTGDSRIGPYFLTSGGPVRNVTRDQVYPQDYRPNQDFIHSNGLIFGSAMWDLWGDLIDLHGEEEGTSRLTNIFTGLVKGGPTLETVFSEAMFADDDDGDLSNGTPNLCELLDQFSEHGLVGITGDGPIAAQHMPIREVGANEPVPVNVDVVNSAPGCVGFNASSGMVSYRIDGGDWEEAALTVSVDDVSGAIPAQPLGTFIEYFVTILDDGGAALKTPSGGEINPFSMYVGDVLPVYANDFEADDGGFTSELVAGEDVDGANDWQHGRPGGQGGDPASAFSGANIWGNDRSPEANWDGRYQDNRYNRLNSPSIDTGHYEGVFLQYERWLTVEDGLFDQARILADGEEVWTNWATGDNNGGDHHIDRQWQLHAVDLGEFASDGNVVLSWEIESDGGLNFGGWNLDDISLFAPNTPDNRLGINDLVLSATEDGRSVELTWTNPAHAPLTDVIIVRTNGDLPEGPEDGTVVATLSDVAVGEAVSFIDDDASRRRTHGYAVYPSDGTDTLSWTRPGFNAATIRLTDEEGVAGGCACSGTGTSPLSAVWLLGLGGLFLRRRR